MPTLIVENMPAEVYERLRRRAESERRSVPEETVHLLDQALRQEVKSLPRSPGEPPLTPGELRKRPREVRQAILAAAAKLAEQDYRDDKELTGFDAFREEELDDDAGRGMRAFRGSCISPQRRPTACPRTREPVPFK